MAVDGHRLARRLLLKVTDLLLQLVDLLLRRRQGRGRPWCLRRLVIVITVQVCTSALRIRMDRPSDRAASGIFLPPKSMINTAAMMSSFHGLSNRSPSMFSPFQSR